VSLGLDIQELYFFFTVLENLLPGTVTLYFGRRRKYPQILC
jgi:hypothetical protein